VLHDSSGIVEYLETLGASPELIPKDPALRVMHRQIEAIADGICDAVVLIVTERARPKERQSADWIARQARKIPAALAELERLLAGKPFFTPHGCGLAEIATGCALGYLELRYPELEWRRSHPGLDALARALEPRASFARTRPEPQALRIG
jgi:glutathione S-transferase